MMSGLLGFIVLTFLLGFSHALKDYDDTCDPTAVIQNIYKSETDPNSCNSEKGLICIPVTNLCKCSPVHVYEEGPIWGIFGGGSCVGRANSPCFGEKQKCTDNSECGKRYANLCTCNEGYWANSQGYCTNGAGKLGSGDGPLKALLPLAIVSAYFLFAQ